MVAGLTIPNEPSAWEELLRPARQPDGAAPEQRVIVCGVSWRQYLTFDKKLGADRSGPRLYFLEGSLEIMSTSDEHERIKEWMGEFLSDFFLEKGLDVVTRGQATLRQAAQEAGAEPDKSWCLDKNKRFPDLVLEIALTSGVSKLEIYRRMKIPEVWFWRHDKIEVFAFTEVGNYEPLEKSRLLPNLDIRLIERCVKMNSWREARKAFRAALVQR